LTTLGRTAVGADATTTKERPYKKNNDKPNEESSNKKHKWDNHTDELIDNC